MAIVQGYGSASNLYKCTSTGETFDRNSNTTAAFENWVMSCRAQGGVVNPVGTGFRKRGRVATRPNSGLFSEVTGIGDKIGQFNTSDKIGQYYGAAGTDQNIYSDADGGIGQKAIDLLKKPVVMLGVGLLAGVLIGRMLKK